MSALFSSMSFLERTGLLIEIFVVIAALILVLRWVLTGKKMKINLSSGNIDIGAADQKDVSKSDVVDIIIKTSDTIMRTAYIKTKLILYEQMCYLEERLVLLQDAYLATFRSKLAGNLAKKSNSPLTVTSSQEYQFFESLIRLLMEDIKRNCRGIFVRNNFSHYTEKEFDNYLEEKVEFLWIKSCNFLRDLYPSDKMPMTYEELENEVLVEVKETSCDDLRAVFRKAVHVHNSKLEEVVRIEQDLRGYLKSFGIEPDLQTRQTTSNAADRREADGR